LEYLSGFYPSTPIRFRDAYQKQMLQLEDNPYSCSVYYAFPEYHRAIVGNYIVLYKIDDAQHQVHIHRILRSNWNIPKYLEPEEEI